MHSSARTARARRKPSRPAAALVDAGLIRGRVLDYGCGRGKDAETFEWEAFDPHWGPKMPRGKFDTIVCTYVLNVLTEEQGGAVIADILSRLRLRGRAYLTVRRDLPRGELLHCGQRRVVLPLPVVLDRTGEFCTYELRLPRKKR